MRIWLLCMLTLICADANAFQVTVSRQSDTLHFSAPEGKYNGVLVEIDGKTIEPTSTSENTWTVVSQHNSGKFFAAKCLEDSCELVECSWRVETHSIVDSILFPLSIIMLIIILLFFYRE